MPDEIEITIRRDYLPGPDLEFGVTETDRDLTDAKVLIEGMPAKRLRESQDSVTVIAPRHGDHDWPLQIVVTTNSDKPVGILNFWWNGHEWEFQTPNADHHRTDDGLSPVIKALGDAAREIVHAIELAEETATTRAGATDKKRRREN
jgi:hypothetical protein